MDQNSEGCMKKIGSVNLDKLINDFAQMEKVCKASTWLQHTRKNVVNFANR